MVVRRMWSLFQVLGFLVGFGLLASAQEVRWSPASGELGDGQTEELQLIFDQCSPEGEVKLPEVEGLEFGRPSQSKQVSIVNFKVSQNVTFTYPTRAKRKGKIEIPSFDILTNKGVVRVPAAKYEVGDAKVAGGKAGDIVRSNLRMNPSTFWEGQVVDLEYGIYVSSRFNGELGGGVEWRPPGVVLEDWSDGRQVQSQFNGESFAGITYKTRGCLLDSRSKSLPEAQQKLRIHSGSRGFGFIFNQNSEDIVVKTSPSPFEVKPLPQPAPPEFLNAVGQFQLKSTVVPLEVQSGDPITWTLELHGTGNWPAGLSLPSREVARTFRVIQPKTKQTLADKKKFEGTLSEDLVLIPSEAGTYSLGPVKFAYFDPSTGTYKTIQSDPVEVRVKTRPGVSAPSVPTSQNLSTPTSSTTPRVSYDEKPILPRDPFVGHAWGWAPSPVIPWSVFGLIFISILGTWGRYAWVRVPETDPWRYRREARTRMIQALSQPLNPETITEWQKAVRAFVKSETPVLSSAEVTSLFESAGFESAPWRALWDEADRALYGPKATLGDDWGQRAMEEANRLTLPNPNRWTLFLPRNLFPLLFLVPMMAAAQVDPVAAYQQGDFETARVSWEKRVNEKPLDWKARANLSLALAQQNRWAEAEGHAAAAFLQHPREESLRWNLMRMADRAKGMDSELGQILQYGQWIYFSPAEWQLLLVLGIIASGAVLFVVLRRRYGYSDWLVCWLQSGLLYGGMILILISGLVLWKYGVLGGTGAALIVEETEIRSVPTEVEKGALEKKLPVGKVVRIEGEFLGWRKVKLGNGETGWVRKQALIPFYQKR